jgi:hypothetical protein
MGTIITAGATAPMFAAVPLVNACAKDQEDAENRKTGELGQQVTRHRRDGKA